MGWKGWLDTQVKVDPSFYESVNLVRMISVSRPSQTLKDRGSLALRTILYSRERAEREEKVRNAPVRSKPSTASATQTLKDQPG